MKIPYCRTFGLTLMMVLLAAPLSAQKKWGREDLSVLRSSSPFIAVDVDSFPSFLRSKIIRSIDKKGILIAQKDLPLFSDYGKNFYSTNDDFKLSSSLNQDKKERLFQNFSGIIQFIETNEEYSQKYKSYNLVWLNNTKTIATIQDYPSLDSLMKDPNIIHIDLLKPFRSEAYEGWADLSLHQITAFQNKIQSKEIPIVSLREGMIDTNNIDLHQQLVSHDQQPTSVTKHASQMAILVAGAGNSFINARGVVPKSKFVMETVNSFFPLMNQKFFSPLQLNSYGTDLEWEYNLEAKEYDDYIYQNNTLFIFSAGNSGTVIPNNGIYKNLSTFSNITGAFKQAKNNLLVGGVDMNTLPVNYSSAGPTYDGRIKPELVAIADNGTSSSAAVAVGIATGLYSLLPSSHHRNDVVKAILISSANDIQKQGINYKTGYGVINANDAAELILQDQYIIDSISTNEVKHYSIDIPTGEYHIRIAMVWNDPPALLQSHTALVNDLDFYLVKGGYKILPWTLSSYPHIDSLQAMATRGIDTLNVVEFISDTLTTGTYQLTVDGSRLISPQTFVIAYYLRPVRSLKFTHPTQDDILIEGMNQIIRWETDLTLNGSIYYRNINDENQWEKIDDINPDLPVAVFNDFSQIGKYQLKIESEDLVFYSDTFLLMPSILLQSQYHCDQQSLFKVLYPTKENLAFQLEYFDVSLNEWSKQTVQSESVIETIANNDSWWRVKPQWNGLNLYPTPAIKTPDQDICYQGSFLVEAENEKVKLNFQTWSLHYIEKIEFQKWIRNEWKTISHWELVGEGDHLYYDIPLDGANVYRSIIHLRNGEIIFSDSQTYYHIGEQEMWIYPNPIRTGQSWNIQLKDPLYKLILIYSSEGYLLKVIRSNDGNITVNIPLLKPGMYFLQLYDKGKLTTVRKLLVQ